MPTEQLAPDNAFVVRFIQDLVRAAAQRGHHILVFTENGDELEAFGKLVARHGVDGFILSGSRVDDPRVQFLAKAAIPSAMFGRTAPDLPQTWVDIDSVAAVGAMVDHLVERGHREFAYLGYDARNSWDLERLEGYRSGLARHGIDVAVTGFDGGFVRQMTEPVLTSVPVPVDVIATELIRRCLCEIDDGPTGAPGLLVPTEIAVGASA